MIYKAQHRTRIDIIFSILKFINSEGIAKKTHILYATNLNTKSLEKFLNQLISINAIEVVSKGRLRGYVMTPHGRRLFSLITRLYNVFEYREKNNDYLELLLKYLILKTSKNLNRQTLALINKIIVGRSGFRYNINLYGTRDVNYIISVIDEAMSIDEIIDSIGRLLFYLVDTNEKCILINNAIHQYPISYFKKIFTQAGIKPDRYTILVPSR